MSARGIIGAALLCAVSGCATQDKIALRASGDQQAIVRNGVPAVVSKKQHVVMVRPNLRIVDSNARPAFTVAVRNMGTRPETLHETSISAWKAVSGKQQQAMRVMKYDELVQEEKTRRTVAAIGVALGGIGRSMSAANAGYSTTTGSFNSDSRGYVGTTNYGASSYGTFSATNYDPFKAQLAQQSAQAQTEADLSHIKMEGDQNLAILEHSILKDNTVLPGEWIGGTIVLDTPDRGSSDTISYTINVHFGGEMHEFVIDQSKS